MNPMITEAYMSIFSVRARSAILGLCATLLGVVAASAWAADPYPNRPIRFVVPFPAGGSADILARLMSERLAVALGQPVVVDNRPGAGGNIGADAAAKAAPDGYTMVFGSTGNMAINATLYPNLPYEPTKDFVPVILWSSEPNMLVVHPELPVKSVRELIDHAKANPGKLNFASSGNGTSQHLAGELFKLMAGLHIVHIPYKGGVGSMNDVLGGRVEMTFSSLIATRPFVQSGRLRALGVTSAERSPALPDVPSIAEAGLPGYEVNVWFGVLFPAGTPMQYVTRMNREIGKILADPEVKTKLTSQGSLPGGGTPEEFAAYIKSEKEKWARVVETAGIRIE
jgi:tripartite-type tricarboxylate transporter receptor subunit TctC